MRFQKSFRVLSALALGLQLQACSKGSDSSSASSTPAVNTVSCDTATGFKNYFEDVDTATDTSSPLEAGVMRERKVKVDLNSLKSDILKGASNLHLDLFQDRSVDVVVEKIQKTSGGGAIVTGRLKDDPLSSMSLAIEKDVVIANINPLQSTHYKIVYRGAGVHAIQEANDTDGENENSCLAETALQAPPAEDTETTAQDTPQEENAQALTATPVIDMLVAYTPAAKAGAGGDSAMKALIETGIANTNKAFTDSGVNLKVRLVGTMAVTQNESGNWSSDLGALASKTDGKWDEVHAERARLGADQVTLVGEFPGGSTAGIGYIKSSSSTAFTVVKRTMFGQYTFTHELGHNIGLQHSDGYVNSSAGFRTIMAYGSVPRILRYSNPSIPYNNYATGTSANNSASILNANATTMAGLVASKIADTVTEVPVTPTTPSTPGAPSGNCGTN